MGRSPDHWRGLAEEARAMADGLTAEENRQQTLEIAKSYTGRLRTEAGLAPLRLLRCRLRLRDLHRYGAMRPNGRSGERRVGGGLSQRSNPAGDAYQSRRGKSRTELI
jgi:hypothetical protein